MRLTIPVVAVVIAILLLVSQSLYTVDQRQYAIRFQSPGTDAGNNHPVFGTNRSSRRDHSLSEGKAAGQIWLSLAQLSFPYYVVSAGISTMVQSVGSHMGWGLALAVFPVMYVIHRSYRLYFGRMVEALRPPVMARAAGAGA